MRPKPASVETEVGVPATAAREPRGAGAPAITIEADLAAEIARRGWTAFRGSSLAVPPEVAPSLHVLANAAPGLGPDPRDATGTRLRAHGEYLLAPVAGALAPAAPRAYWQELALNPIDGGIDREFAPLPPEVRDNLALHALIRFAADRVPEHLRAELEPLWRVGVHVIAYCPRPGVPATSSPNELHKDGEPITWTFLLRREGVAGGESSLADNAKAPFASFTLDDFLDGFAFDDRRVYHGVAPVTLAPGAASGIRLVVLVDFSRA